MSEGYNVGLSFQAFEVTHSLRVCVCVLLSLLPPSVCLCVCVLSNVWVKFHASIAARKLITVMACVCVCVCVYRGRERADED